MSKKKGKGKHRSMAEGSREPLTQAHTVAEAEMAESGRPDDQAARKAAIPGLEAEPDPGTFGAPVMPPAAGQFARPYLDTGHSAPSPQQGPPNVAPLPPQHPGILTPLPQSPVAEVVGTGPIVAGLAAHQARATQTMPPMP